MKPRSYKEAGVDIEREDQTIAAIVSQLTYKRGGFGAPLDLPGFFTGLVDFGEWALTLNMDGVGTKLMVAEALEKWDTVGIDCVAMNVNDALCVGSEPLAMVDYFAVSKYDEEVARQVGLGLNKGAELANITLIGGEFATVPEIVRGYDLVGTCLGYLPKDRIVNGKGVRDGQVIIGLRSSGLHSNGYTLVRRLLESHGVRYTERVPGTSKRWGETLLRPTEIYVKEVLKVLTACRISGMAHLTGGGVTNLSRIRPNVLYELTDPFPPQAVFVALQELGEIEMSEMYTTFNMGQGYALTVEEREADVALEILKKNGREAKVIGHVARGKGVSIPQFDIQL